MTDRYKSRASTSADGCGKWYIVDVVVREKILVEVSSGEDEYDAKGIALDESRLFRQTEKTSKHRLTLNRSQQPPSIWSAR